MKTNNKNQESLERRQKAYRHGLRAEHYAGFYLQACGYQILQHRYKTPAGEIDLIAKKNKTISLIEVKLRNSLDNAVEAVTPQIQMRIARSGQLFLSRFPSLNNLGMRYDIIAVAGWRIRHIRDAWRDI